MKNLKELFESKKSNSEINVNKIMLEILKNGKKLTRTDLKIEMFKVRFEIKNKIAWKDEYLNDKKFDEIVKKLLIESRNSIDTLISKNNSKSLFIEFGIEDKIQKSNDLYFLNITSKQANK